MRKILLGILTLLSVSFAQKTTWRFDIKGLPNDSAIIVGQYFGNRIAYKDTVVAQQDQVKYQLNMGDITPGMYALVIPVDTNVRYFNFIYNNEKEIHITSEMSNIDFAAKAIKSEENKALFTYMQFIANMNKESKKCKEGDQACFEALNSKVKNFQNEFLTEHKDRFVSKFVRMNIEPNIPETAPYPVEDTRMWRYMYYLDHYWDNVDLSDARMVHTVNFYQKVDYFFQKAVPQEPDSIIKRADLLLAELPEKTDLYKYVLHYLTYKYETSKIICFDKVFAHMALNYYKNDKAFWLDSTKIAQIVERGTELAPTLCGEVTPNIMLPDTSGKKFYNLHNLKSKYKLLIFWEHSCGHCKKEIPVLLQSLAKYPKEVLQVMAVETDLNTDGWKKYLNEHPEMGAWINVSDNEEMREQDQYYRLIKEGYTSVESLNFRQLYDIFATPKIYLIDENNVIKAKGLNAETVEKLLDHFIEQDKKVNK